ncbi:hypothetical protein [Sphingobium algorifonticola]|uniref:Uncharacterized protein n=1 Tax=Sphingobium algorifonticola TaxID=2008318 RepID=A0A437JCM0_9SPHN|nr:hypothetical protein [Sphingobium algorifonticola]RVT43641.1 hypothetical protein ENE74_03265 [Sphingobium algorifonticola]
MNDSVNLPGSGDGGERAPPESPVGMQPSPAPTGDSSGGADMPVQRAFRERRRGRTPWLIAGVMLAFLGGVTATLLLYPRLAGWWVAPATPQAVVSAAPVEPPRDLAGGRPMDAARQDLLAVRMMELEDRLARISVAAQTASGNATRAEGLMVAFAARRALDSGAPLGYVEGQLRLRFGQAQPRAVATIINAAREPVTLTDLQGGFAEIAPSLAHSPPGTSWWTAFRQEARNLVIIRKTATPSPLPERTIPRIERLLAAGRVAPAMEEVGRLPGKAAAEGWLDMARRYREARRALDLIETAAILESPPAAVLPPGPAPSPPPIIVPPPMPSSPE